jgi:hypothetical protein
VIGIHLVDEVGERDDDADDRGKHCRHEHPLDPVDLLHALTFGETVRLSRAEFAFGINVRPRSTGSADELLTTKCALPGYGSASPFDGIAEIMFVGAEASVRMRRRVHARTIVD